jgi:hypothetical protein
VAEYMSVSLPWSGEDLLKVVLVQRNARLLLRYTNNPTGTKDRALQHDLWLA